MHISSQKVGEDHFTHQLQISVALGLPIELKVTFHSSGRDGTSYHILDEVGESMGRRRFQYGIGMNCALVGDLNVLLDQYNIQVKAEDFVQVCADAHRTCDGRYGNGIKGGDVVVTIH